jgi:hypothetical protein
LRGVSRGNLPEILSTKYPLHSEYTQLDAPEAAEVTGTAGFLAGSSGKRGLRPFV